jgi:hypothetical protein
VDRTFKKTKGSTVSGAIAMVDHGGNMRGKRMEETKGQKANGEGVNSMTEAFLPAS